MIITSRRALLKGSAAAAGLGLLGTYSKPARAQATDLESVWRGNRVDLIIGENPGGSFDTVARLVGRYLEKYIPGEPTVVPQNMPGADGRVPANFLMTAPNDGLTFGFFDQGVPFYQLSGETAEQGVRYDVRQMNWLGACTVLTYVLAVKGEVGITPDSLDKLKTTTIRTGQSSPGDGAHLNGVVLAHALGWQIKPIFGYDGSDARELGIDRGEFDGYINSADGYISDRGEDIRAGRQVPLVQVGKGYQHELLEGVPTAAELFEAAGVPEIDKQMLQIVEGRYRWGRPMVAPPGTDPEVVTALRDAFAQVFRDQQFLDELAQTGRYAEFTDGNTVQELVGVYMETPREAVDLLAELVAADVP